MREFEQVLAWLRSVDHPCAPPIGVGEFEVLYASPREVVVWYAPARTGHRAGEVAIPCARLAAAWERLVGGTPLDEAALTALGMGVAGGRWLLAVLAQLPGVRAEPEPLTLTWTPAPVPGHEQAPGRAPARRRDTRRLPRASAPADAGQAPTGDLALPGQRERVSAATATTPRASRHRGR